MINAVNIGKRIRMLRKQKHLSQEAMALDLGMYQADISNLERAMGGSGITDLNKLDMIADYFGISLGELISGPDAAIPTPSSEKNKPEENAIMDHRIVDARYANNDLTFASELLLEAPDGKRKYITFIEHNDVPCFYQTPDSLWNGLLEHYDDASYRRSLRPGRFLSGEDYFDVFRNIDPKWCSICRYLIYIGTEKEEAANSLIERTKALTLAEIDVPIPGREPEDLFEADYSDLSAVYRYRLMVEAGLKNPSVFSDYDDTKKREKAILEKLKAACISEEAYKVWRKDLIDAKIGEVTRNMNLVACTYIFAGIGQYKEIMPEEMIDCFKAWIDANGSAFFCGYTPATKREIRTFVSHHIADELLGIPSPI